jgi:glutaryl-CoA dehydrogenase
MQEKLVEMLDRVTLGQLLAYRLGRLKDGGKLKHTQVSLAKRHNVMMAREVASTARWALGANGIHSEYQVMRHMCNLESVFTYEGTHDIHTLIVGQDITGLNAFT